ncbi:unnamed protein product, partial [Mesorhabditis belari]|uniref:Glycoprotein hormone subunit beta domain-containing protein n=1 Tax=Mesorhabditis belari TaxID=2138241 RepID=A0AAF3ESR5_9BILA
MTVSYTPCKKHIAPNLSKLNGDGGISEIVRTDKNGKTCRMEVTQVPYCMGMCKTGEFGTYTTDFRQQNSSMCGYVNPKFEEITMSDCDEGVDPEIRIVKILDQDTECGCVPVPPKDQ